MTYNEILEMLDKNNSVVFGDYTVIKDDCNTIFCTHKYLKSKNFIISDQFDDDLFKVCLYSEKQNLIDSFINYSAVSNLLYGTPRAINSNRIPDKHAIAINELRNLVKKWIDKHKKSED